jgi:CheY-like chemotaxis protein
VAQPRAVPLAVPTQVGNGGGPRAESVALPEPLTDDRADLTPGDRIALVMTEERELARSAVDIAHRRGFKCLLALRGDAGLALVHEFMPKAVVLSSSLPQVEGTALLDHLKRHPETRHIPVYVIGNPAEERELRASGALGVVPGPITDEALGRVFDVLGGLLDRRGGSVLLVAEEGAKRQALAELIGGGGVAVVSAGSREEALAALQGDPSGPTPQGAARSFDCVVLDPALDGGFAVLDRIRRAKRFHGLAVIVHPGRELTVREEARLERYAQSVVLKDARSPERVLEETSLYLHRAEARLPAEKRRMLDRLHSRDEVFDGKKVLIVDDDVRNVFALTSVFERHGMRVVFAENGREGIEALKEHPDVSLVLMDIMMPEMDGYEATRTVREMPEFERLPIVALTAKAMRGDREKSLASGASDYITKPVDIDQLLSLMRVWLHR